MIEPHEQSMALLKPCLGVTGLAILMTLASGCTREATLVRDMEKGGLVSYPFQTDVEVLASSGRRDAFQLITEKCPKGSRIIQEGEIPKVSRAADRAWRGQMGVDRLWGVQFVCE
jgi:hypothetical protein